MQQIIPHFKPYGDSAILIEWPDKIDQKTLEEILIFKNKLQTNIVKEILYINNAYSSILIKYVSAIDKINDEILSLKQLFSTEVKTEVTKNYNWKIPVCYDKKFGLDLLEIASVKSLSISEIIELHKSSFYTVYFIGFLPGFLYLGGLHSRLHFSRKAQPRLQIEKGSVGIGGSQTGIYPTQSPGGWNIIGNSPIDFFNLYKEIPCFAKPGDGVRFVTIDLEQHQSLKNEVDNGVFDYNTLKSERQEHD